MLPVEGYVIESTEIAGIPVILATYKIGDIYHCLVANKRMGGNVARSSGPTADAALIGATREARRRLLVDGDRV